MYVHLFELLLRLKANYLWPAMWSNAFNEDDPMSPVLADEYGIVMGTSHHEPMMRAHKEYTSRRQEIGDWNYATNKKNIDKFFIDGLERNKRFDNLITIGMRGDGDKAMGNGDDQENMTVLKNVIDGQRKSFMMFMEKIQPKYLNFGLYLPKFNVTMMQVLLFLMMSHCCFATITGDISVVQVH